MARLMARMVTEVSNQEERKQMLVGRAQSAVQRQHRAASTSSLGSRYKGCDMRPSTSSFPDDPQLRRADVTDPALWLCSSLSLGYDLRPVARAADCAAQLRSWLPITLVRRIIAGGQDHHQGKSMELPTRNPVCAASAERRLGVFGFLTEDESELDVLSILMLFGCVDSLSLVNEVFS
ncbi:hypothetical protein OPT61_g9863 [Boeremia exigua]|uniref:Uncharacterized protein n=1 Tax=Boeremia exigua TaxID=749465 RepID=A0ACC2HSA4_9PLEO|nr:hypothetical protein OPT61_g9863 [Boeremia exigua]